MRRHAAVVLTFLLLLLPALRVSAQWLPTGALAAVPVVRDCNETGGDVAVSRLEPPTVYLCPTVVRLIRRRNPGAEHFYFVHEFGHIAQGTSDEAAADCWAARELAKAPNGRRYLSLAIEHFRQRPNEPSRRYGTPGDRAERVRACAEDALPSDAAPGQGGAGKAGDGAAARPGDTLARFSPTSRLAVP